MDDCIEVLDHGFVRLVDSMGGDIDIVRARDAEMNLLCKLLGHKRLWSLGPFERTLAPRKRGG